MAYFSDVGAHCSRPSCRQADFLPFKCHQCNDTFCLDHFKPEEHTCRNAGMFDTRVIVCPDCQAPIKTNYNEKEDITLAKHKKTNCRPRNKSPPKTCPVKGCREQLTIVTNFTCKLCGTAVCLRHRLPDDHSCSSIESKPTKTKPQKTKLSNVTTTSVSPPEASPKHEGSRRRKGRLSFSRCSIQWYTPL